jgi:hypothetical protein
LYFWLRNSPGSLYKPGNRWTRDRMVFVSKSFWRPEEGRPKKSPGASGKCVKAAIFMLK